MQCDLHLYPDEHGSKLVCRIETFEEYGIRYQVFDGDVMVSAGTSSNVQWMIHDAGGYHTARKFNEAYPDGWWVEFPEVDLPEHKADS